MNRMNNVEPTSKQLVEVDDDWRAAKEVSSDGAESKPNQLVEVVVGDWRAVKIAPNERRWTKVKTSSP